MYAQFAQMDIASLPNNVAAGATVAMSNAVAVSQVVCVCVHDVNGLHIM